MSKLAISAASLAAAVIASQAQAAAAFAPFKDPAQAATRLTAVINTQLVTKKTTCKVDNPYRISCNSFYKYKGSQPARIVFHKINPYMLLMEVWLLGQHNVSQMETKVPY